MSLLENINFFDFGTIVVLYLLIFSAIVLRYVIVSGAYYYIFFVVFRDKFKRGILAKQNPKSTQLRREVILSFYSALIFGLIGLFLLIMWHSDVTQIYLDPAEFSPWYIPFSILVFLFFHDTYYYWLHRWMHHSKWLRPFHMEHHKSINTNVLTAFSFHPVESLLQAIILPILFTILPMHLTAVFFVLTIMTLSATINHAGVEIYTQKGISMIKKFIIGATHHDIHHRHARRNLGLYFTFWDKLMKTEY